MRRTIGTLLALAAVSLSTGCSDSSGPASMTGGYALNRIDGINGTGLPVVIFKDATGEVRLTSGSLTLSSDNTFIASGSGVLIEAGQTTTISETCAGTYALSGNGITYTGSSSSDCDGAITGTWDGSNTVSINISPTVQAVFKR